MKYFILVLTILTSGFYSKGQNPVAPCASQLYVKQLEAQFPGLQQKIEDIALKANYRTRSTTVTIPIVFHVVYNNSTENLSDAYLNAQVDLLNKCFARQNSDTSNMRSIYSSRVGPSKIRFLIDQIKRVSTTKTSFDASSTSGMSGSDQVKMALFGGSDAISPSTKLNIWVCDLTIDGTDGLLGYAYPPVGAPNWSPGSGAPFADLDGVVIDYVDVGGPAKQPLAYSSGFRGKSLVHEVGHYLGLRHIWGDDNGACIGQPGYKDDGLSDTPVADDASNFNCDKSKNTCNEGSGDLPDMVENYMDYSSGSCQNSFTKMQVGAMEYVIDNLRPLVRVPLSTDNYDALAHQLILYPNPADAVLYLDASQLGASELDVQLVNTLGETIYAEKFTSLENPFSISVAQFAAGVYFLRWHTEVNHLVRTEKIMIH